MAWRCDPSRPGAKQWTKEFIPPTANADDMDNVSVQFADGTIKEMAELTVLDYKTHKANQTATCAMCHGNMLHPAHVAFQGLCVNVHLNAY